MGTESAEENRFDIAYEAWKKADKNVTDAAVARLRARMLRLAEKYGVAVYSFDAEYQYDDEGGYSYSPSFTAEPVDEETSTFELMEEVTDSLYEVYWSGEALAKAFDSDEMSGEISVSDLKEKYAAV